MDSLHQVNFLVFFANELGNFVFLHPSVLSLTNCTEVDFVNSLEALFEVLLDVLGFLRLT